MRALQLVAGSQTPVFADVPEPEAGPGEVVVRIGGAGACHSDLHLLEGLNPFPPPFTLGHENAGWVHALGAGVTALEVGQPVAVYGPWGCGVCRHCRLGMENYCERAGGFGAGGGGLGQDGGMAPLMKVPAARLLIPLDTLDPVQAAPLTDAGLTPYHAIRRSLGLLVPGSSAAVIGVGGLGHLAIQILRAISPARIIAVDPREESRSLALESGADHAVGAGEDQRAEILDATKGRGVDFVLDTVGVDATLALAASIARTPGHVTIVGLGGGSCTFGFFRLPYEVSMTTCYWGYLPELQEVIALAEAGHLTPHVSTFGLDEAATVYEKLHHGEIKGRAVITPN